MRLHAIVASLIIVSIAVAEPWPQWRGPTGDSVVREAVVPLKWSETENVVWKCSLPDGASTPAVWGDAIFLTGADGEKLTAYRIDARAGTVVWSKIFANGTPRREPVRGLPGGPRAEQRFHKLHNLASPSPTTDGKLVIWHFGTGDLVATDFDGKELWRHDMQKEYGRYTIWWGHSNSPVLYGDLVISVCMQDSLADVDGAEVANSYLVAHDKASGAERWKTPRMTPAQKEHCDSYTTPVFRTVNGKTELIVVGAEQIDAYDPATGKRLWYLPDFVGNRTITGPTLIADVLIATKGMRGEAVGLKLGGIGELSQDAIRWRLKKGTPDTPCPVAANGLAFFVSDNGIATCVDVLTGDVRWEERLKGDFKASPITAQGRVYFLNLTGKCTVVRAANKFEVLAENAVEDETIASLAASDGALYVRGRKALYKVR
ncbi:MAG: PQQ-binding-like beta-propeller repeat protein [Gemmataceae bacterium]